MCLPILAPQAGHLASFPVEVKSSFLTKIVLWFSQSDLGGFPEWMGTVGVSKTDLNKTKSE
jgi:hypothetical protein